MKKDKSFSRRLHDGEKEFLGENLVLDKPVENKTFNGLVFHQSDVSGQSFIDTRFEKAVFKSSLFSEMHFSNCRFLECSGNHYFFDHCSMVSSHFQQSDFSGGAFDTVDFSEVHFTDCEFVLCEFKDVHFGNARFTGCNFNASVFENASFEGARFENTTFKYVEGISPSQMSQMKSNGADVCPPIEIAFKDTLVRLFKTCPPIPRGLLIALFFFILGFHARFLFQKGWLLFQIDANPLSRPISYLGSRNTASFFDFHLNLPNFNFSEKLDHWRVIPSPPLSSQSDQALEIVHNQFSSFPSALHAKHFNGQIYYTRTPQSPLPPEDPLQHPDLWLEVNERGEKLKLSFYYKNGHPRFSVYGRFLKGGFKILAEVDPRRLSDHTSWTFFSEAVLIPPGFQAVCLKLSSFPDQTIYLDDINLESSL